MTIAKRLLLLLSIPLATLVGLGVFTKMELDRIDERGRFVAETQISSLAVAATIMQTFSDLRADARSYLLVDDAKSRSELQTAVERRKAEVARLLRQYADTLVSDERDRALTAELRERTREWIAGAEQAMALAAAGDQRAAVAHLTRGLAPLGEQVNVLLADWTHHNQAIAKEAGDATIVTIQRASRALLLAVLLALALSATLGLVTYRRIVRPLHGLQTSVEAIAKGDFAQAVPFTRESDETGSLARSVEVLKRGAASMEEQRWIKTNAARISAELQSATTFADLGQHVLSGLVPALGGGVAAVYRVDAAEQRVKLIASYGLGERQAARPSFALGDGLIGQCARDRQAIALTDLPPDYLGISSGLGSAAPSSVVAWPLVSQGEALGVVEFASFRPLAAKETALVEELLPIVALSMEILARNVRTRELLEQTQEQARKLEVIQKLNEELREANEQLETFSYSVSHDLRAPLRSLQGFSEVLLEDYADKLDDEARLYLQRIKSATLQMEQLTRDLLQYCRVAREDMTPQAVEVNALIKDVMAMNNFVLPSSAQFVIRDGMARVLANPTLLSQCLSNLLQNAFKFATPNVPPRVEVWTERQASRVRIHVQDNGIGIDPAHHQKIFGIFERVGNVKEHDGTGIGLAIVARAVQRMGGHCGVDSKLGAGSRFWIELQSAP